MCAAPQSAAAPPAAAAGTLDRANYLQSQLFRDAMRRFHTIVMLILKVIATYPTDSVLDG